MRIQAFMGICMVFRKMCELCMVLKSIGKICTVFWILKWFIRSFILIIDIDRKPIVWKKSCPLG